MPPRRSALRQFDSDCETCGRNGLGRGSTSVPAREAVAAAAFAADAVVNEEESVQVGRPAYSDATWRVTSGDENRETTGVSYNS